VGPAFRENSLLAVAMEFQNRTDWHKRRPPVS
jgi:Asp-tRNA(Asn)/Glu-tRNA(Gln) amidotransferase A subunit family amidase